MASEIIPPTLAVVTGASTGIGRALAVELCAHDHDVLLVADEPEVHAAAEEARQHGGTATPVRADLATADGVGTVAGRVRHSGRAPGIVALNAGIGVNGRFDQTPVVDQLRLVDLNVRSVVHLARLLLPAMVEVGDGRLLVTSSVAAVAPGPFQATYAASKAFGHSFAEALHEELRGTGVSVTSLMPGPTDTEFFRRADMEDDTRLGASAHKDDPAQVAREAYGALVERRPSVVSGSFLNRLQAEAATHAPDRVTARIFRRLTEPGSA